jgi:hypothetical protein
MTRDEILKLSGHEIDAMIAKDVMGWLEIYHPDRWINENDLAKELPHYSTDMSDAWDVVEKIKSWGEGWCPQIYWDDNDGLEPGDWVAEFNKYWKVENDYRHTEAVADTAPLAICQAALLAVIERTEE